jgi:hypothetical protein
MIYEKKCRATVHVYKTRKKVKIITKRSVHYCVHKTIDLGLLKVIMEFGQFRRKNVMPVNKNIFALPSHINVLSVFGFPH